MLTRPFGGQVAQEDGQRMILCSAYARDVAALRALLQSNMT
jgi:hypothetical protein